MSQQKKHEIDRKDARGELIQMIKKFVEVELNSSKKTHENDQGNARGKLLREMQIFIEADLQETRLLVEGMKPERVQMPSILIPQLVSGPSVSWRVFTQRFAVACQLVGILCSLLGSEELIKSVNISNDWVEVWISKEGLEEAEVSELLSQVDSAVEECLKAAGVPLREISRLHY